MAFGISCTWVFPFVCLAKKTPKLAADGTKAEGEDEGLGDEVKTDGEGNMQPDAADLSSSDSEMESEDEDDEDKVKEGIKDDKVLTMIIQK